MAIVVFQIIKVTSDSFNGPRYWAHVPGVGFCIIPREGDDFDRRVLKFNSDSIYDANELEVRLAQIEREYPGHKAVAVNAMASPVQTSVDA